MLTPYGDHKEDYTDKNCNCSMLLLSITDTHCVRFFLAGSQALKVTLWR